MRKELLPTEEINRRGIEERRKAREAKAKRDVALIKKQTDELKEQLLLRNAWKTFQKLKEKPIYRTSESTWRKRKIK